MSRSLHLHGTLFCVCGSLKSAKKDFSLKKKQKQDQYVIMHKSPSVVPNAACINLKVQERVWNKRVLEGKRGFQRHKLAFVATRDSDGIK